MQSISTHSALGAYEKVLLSFEKKTCKHNHNFEIQDVFLEIKGRLNEVTDLRAFLDYVSEHEPQTLGKGFRKAERAYVRTGDRITKPSYIKRIRSFPDYSGRDGKVKVIDQIKSVARVFCAEPNASYHVISIFRPIDLMEKFRPGYVPCVVSADFKYRDGRLNGKFFFRSCDAFNLLPLDIFYCFGILEQLYQEVVSRGFDGDLSIGDVTFWFSRIYISRFDIDRREEMLKLIAKLRGEATSRRGRSTTANLRRKQQSLIARLGQAE